MVNVNMRILLIEDEPHLVSAIQKGLGEEGFSVTAAYDGETGFTLASMGGYDLVVLDIILPHINGWELCRRIRHELKVDAPILMLSALNETEHIVKGLRQGADDYLGKPFKMTELVARLQALHRRYRNQPSAQDVLMFSDLTMDLHTKEVRRGDYPVRLTAKEFHLLEFFLRHPRRLLTRLQIMEGVWGVDFEPSTNLVDVYVNYLRNKLEAEGAPRLIHTIFGMGYIMKETHENEE